MSGTAPMTDDQLQFFGRCTSEPMSNCNFSEGATPKMKTLCIVFEGAPPKMKSSLLFSKVHLFKAVR